VGRLWPCSSWSSRVLHQPVAEATRPLTGARPAERD
jgi:hypothetical protein